MKFYKTLFAALCFAFFLAGMSTQSPFAFLVALVCGVLYRTAERKGWSAPEFMRRS